MRRAAAILAAALALAACGEGAQERPSGGIGASAGSSGDGKGLKIGLPTGKTSFANVDVVVAQEKGFFREQGLEVQFLNFASGLKAVQAVIGGGADVAGSSIEPVIAARAREQPLRIIGTYADRLTVNMTTPKEIGSPRELDGKPLGIQDVGAFREIMTRFVLQENGLTPDDVEYRPVSADGYVGALLAGQIESAILQQEQYFSVAERDKGFHAIVDLYKLEPDWFYGTYFTTTKWLGEHREQAVAFLTALTQAHRFMYDNRAETVRIAAQATGFSREAVDKAYDVLMERNKVFPRNDGLDERRLRYTLGKMGDLKAVSGKVPDVSDIVDRGPVEEAVRKLGRQPGR